MNKHGLLFNSRKIVVEAVPSTWIQGQFCHWPTYSQDKIMNAIKKHEPLKTSWPSYKIKNFRNSTFSEFLNFNYI